MTHEQRAGLARLMLLWPDCRAVLQLKSSSDRILLEICEGYDLACGAVAYWSKSTAVGAAEIADDYRYLVFELESEARQRINLLLERDRQ